MRLYIDSANTKQISHLCEYFPISGVTTNPSIIAKENQPYLDLLKEIRTILGNEKELFVQTLGDKAEEIVAEAEHIIEQIKGKVIIKIPVTDEGIKAIKILKEKGINTLATTIYTSFQAYIAASAGASFVAPYVNRIDNLTGNGVNVVKEIVQIFNQAQLSCEIIGASFKNVQQVHDACLAGAHAVAVAPDIIEKFIYFPSTLNDVAQFKREWKAVYGEECDSLIKTK